MSGLYRRPPQPHQRSRFQTQPPVIEATGAGTQAAAGGAGYESAVLTDSPVAYWRLDEGSGATVMVDQVGAINGTYRASAGLGATGLIADGTALDSGSGGIAYASSDGPLDFGGSLTIEAWVRIDTVSDYATIFENHHADNNGGYYLALTGGWTGVRLGVRGGGTSAEAFTDSGDMTTGVTSHIVAAFNDSSNFVDFYVNGVLVASASGFTQAMTSNVASGHYATIGGRDYTNSGTVELRFDGVIDEVAIYDYALSAARALAHYNAGIAAAGGTGVETFTGTGAGTQAAATSSGDGTSVLDVTGTGAGTQAAQSGAGDAVETFTGTGAGTQAAATATGDGIETIATGTGAGTQAAATAEGAGEVSEPATTGTGAGTQAAASADGTGLLTLTGTGAGTQAAATGSGTAAETFTATGSGTQTPATAAGDGTSLIAVTGTGAGVQAAATAEGTGLQTQAVTGTGAGTQQPATGYGVGIGGEAAPGEEPSFGHGALLNQRAKVVGPAQPRIVQLVAVKGTGGGEQAAASARGTGFVNDDELVIALLEAA